MHMLQEEHLEVHLLADEPNKVEVEGKSDMLEEVDNGTEEALEYSPKVLSGLEEYDVMTCYY